MGKEHEALLEKKANEEIAMKKQIRADGQAKLQKWYEERRDKIAKAKSLNRSQEQDWMKVRDANNRGNASNPWERVMTLIEDHKVSTGTPSDAATKGPGTPRKASEAPPSSTARMKSLLVSLKVK